MMDENTYQKLVTIGKSYGVNKHTLKRWRYGLPRRWQMDVLLRSREMRLGLTAEAIEAVSLPRSGK